MEKKKKMKPFISVPNFEKSEFYETQSSIQKKLIENNIKEHKNESEFYVDIIKAIETTSIGRLLKNIEYKLCMKKYKKAIYDIKEDEIYFNKVNINEILCKKEVIRKYNLLNKNDDEKMIDDDDDGFEDDDGFRDDDDDGFNDEKMFDEDDEFSDEDEKMNDDDDDGFEKTTLVIKEKLKENCINPISIRSVNEEKSSFFTRSFNECFNFEKSCGYISEVSKNLKEFYVEKLECLTYYDVHDYFRQPLGFLTINRDIINESNIDKKEMPCKKGGNCWAMENFNIVLRKFKNYDYCICCIRQHVNDGYIQNNINSTCLSISQPHYYIVDNPPIKVNGIIYKNYSSEHMIFNKANKPFLGINEPFPIHNVDRYKLKDNIEVIVNGKIYKVRGLVEKPHVFF